MTKISNKSIVIFLNILIIGILFYSINLFGMNQIGGFDHSAMIETAWRIKQGFKPIIDFYCTFPILFYLGLDLSYDFFGVQWSSFIFINSIFSIIFYFLFYFLIMRISNNEILSIIVSFSFISITCVYIGYWWYSSISTIIIIFFGLSTLYYLKERNIISYVFFIISIFLLSTTKPNQAAVLLILSSFYLICFDKQRSRIFLAYLYGFVLHLILLSYYNLNILDELKSFISISGRGFPSYQIFLGQFNKFDRYVIIIQLILILYPLIFFNKIKFKDGFISIRVIGILLILTGVYGIFTNYEAKQLEMPIIFLGVTFLYYNLFNNSIFVKFKIWLFFIISMFIIYGFLMGEKRDRVRLIGEYNQYEKTLISNNSFFNGIQEGQEFRNLIHDLKIIVNKYKEYKVFFGPRIEYAYTYFNLPSNIIFPTWWHPGTSFPLSDEKMIVNNFVNSDIEILIFYKNDMTYYGKDIIEAINNNFNLIESNVFYIWKRK